MHHSFYQLSAEILSYLIIWLAVRIKNLSIENTLIPVNFHAIFFLLLKSFGLMIDAKSLQLRTVFVAEILCKMYLIQKFYSNKIQYRNYTQLGNDALQMMLSVSSSLDSNTVKMRSESRPNQESQHSFIFICHMALRRTYQIGM